MKILESASPENCFYCIDGSVLHNLLELRQKLKAITPQAFYHHVSQSKNDFHNWIRDVFQDYELADDILKAKTPAAAAAAVDRHIRRALLAEEEIEQAISKIIKARTRAVKPALTAAAKPKSSKDDLAQSQIVQGTIQHRQQPMRIDPRSIAHSAKSGIATESRLGKPKRKPQMKRKKTGKKRKLNKKHNASKQKAAGRSRAEKPKSLKSDWAQSPGRRLGRGKKQANMWLKWLKLVPEL